MTTTRTRGSHDREKGGVGGREQRAGPRVFRCGISSLRASNGLAACAFAGAFLGLQSIRFPSLVKPSLKSLLFALLFRQSDSLWFRTRRKRAPERDRCACQRSSAEGKRQRSRRVRTSFLRRSKTKGAPLSRLGSASQRSGSGFSAMNRKFPSRVSLRLKPQFPLCRVISATKRSTRRVPGRLVLNRTCEGGKWGVRGVSQGG